MRHSYVSLFSNLKLSRLLFFAFYYSFPVFFVLLFCSFLNVSPANPAQSASPARPKKYKTRKKNTPPILVISETQTTWNIGVRSHTTPHPPPAPTPPPRQKSKKLIPLVRKVFYRTNGRLTHSFTQPGKLTYPPRLKRPWKADTARNRRYLPQRNKS